ncbi:MAG: hypothetical protein K6B45_06175 [Bacteroidaceae bacterium]|nr:hypothetical protein [Bacteroidaceae bacterium]
MDSSTIGRYGHVAIRSGSVAKSATEHNIRRAINRTYGTSSKTNCNIACDRAAGVTAAIDTSKDSTARHAYVTTSYTCLITAAINTVADRTIDDIDIRCATISSMVTTAKHVAYVPAAGL